MEEISTSSAPESIGPFSQGIISESTVYVSGQGPVDPKTDKIVNGDIRAQTRQTLENIESVLNAADCTFEDVVKATVFVTDMNTYEEVNDIYGEYMKAPFPARSAVEVNSLPIDIDVEIEVVAEY